ncbi:Hypothetical predicted protein [Scomber scombrus]|uniref:Uncharacterized protein n=1 Tax=Scomber scombrus TaxID=13677 RepID=A0AAV1MZL5_SCOSC
MLGCSLSIHMQEHCGEIFVSLWSWARAPVRLVMTVSLLCTGGERGGFTSAWFGLFTMKAYKVEMITMLRAKFVFSQTAYTSVKRKKTEDF